jgi:hypothetical protein
MGNTQEWKGFDDIPPRVEPSSTLTGKIKFELERLFDDAIQPILDDARDNGYGRIRTGLNLAITAPISLTIFGSMYVAGLPLIAVDGIRNIYNKYSNRQ